MPEVQKFGSSHRYLPVGHSQSRLPELLHQQPITLDPLFLLDSLEKLPLLSGLYNITFPSFDLITSTSFSTYAHSIMEKTHHQLALVVSASFPSYNWQFGAWPQPSPDNFPPQRTPTPRTSKTLIVFLLPPTCCPSAYTQSVPDTPNSPPQPFTSTQAVMPAFLTCLTF